MKIPFERRTKWLHNNSQPKRDPNLFKGFQSDSQLTKATSKKLQKKWSWRVFIQKEKLKICLHGQTAWPNLGKSPKFICYRLWTQYVQKIAWNIIWCLVAQRANLCWQLPSYGIPHSEHLHRLLTEGLRRLTTIWELM